MTYNHRNLKNSRHKPGQIYFGSIYFLSVFQFWVWTATFKWASFNIQLICIRIMRLGTSQVPQSSKLEKFKAHSRPNLFWVYIFPIRLHILKQNCHIKNGLASIFNLFVLESCDWVLNRYHNHRNLKNSRPNQGQIYFRSIYFPFIFKFGNRTVILKMAKLQYLTAILRY